MPRFAAWRSSLWGLVAFLGECAAERFTAAFDAFVTSRRASGDTRSAADGFALQA